MNPIKKFESCAQSLWASDLEPREKAKRLQKLSETISAYLARVPAESKAGADPWAVCARNRSIAYLRSLAEDTRKLADTTVAAK